MSRSIAWLTPFSAKSDISAFSKNLLSELEHRASDLHASTSVLVNENGPSYWSCLPQIPLSGTSVDDEILASFDFCVFNIGNNQENHGNINAIALRTPGIVIVHDLAMQHYFANYFFDSKGRKDLYAQAMAEYYGSEGLDVVSFSHICSVDTDPVYAPWDTHHVTQFPLIEPFAKTAAALVVHSAFAENLIRPLTTAPILRLQLPWDQKPFLTESELEEWRHKTRMDRTCSIMCFGHIGRAKCLDLVIEAFSRSARLLEKATLTIVGYPGDKKYVDELTGQVAALGLKTRITFELSVSDTRLLALKKDADIFVNLRFPNTESASGSLIEQMNAGKPVVIYSTGSYAEVAADAAVHLDRESGAQGIMESLERLVSDPELRIEIGRRGLESVRRIGKKEYIEHLWQFILDNENLLRPRKACYSSRRLGETLPTTSLLGSGWLSDVVSVRRLLALADSPRHVIDIRIFQKWPAALLASYIATGLFGQLPHSRLERIMLQLVTMHEPIRIYRAVTKAHALWLFLFNEPHISSNVSALTSVPMLDPLGWIILTALGPRAFANGCYLYLLGRLPYPNEAEKCADDIELESPANIIGGFIGSDEFSARNVPAHEAEQLRHWMDEAEQSEVLFPRLPINGTLSFSSDTPEIASYLVRGWHLPETDGVWSQSARSAVRFQLPPPWAEDEQSLMRMRGRLALPFLAGERILRISCNGSALSSTTIFNDSWFELEVILPSVIREHKNFLLEFDCGDTVNLAQLEAGSDTRNLGLLLSEISLGRPYSPQAAPNQLQT